jgi:hypothetical protein
MNKSYAGKIGLCFYICDLLHAYLGDSNACIVEYMHNMVGYIFYYSMNVFDDGLLLLVYFFWTSSIFCFLRSLKNPKTLKITTFRRMNLP